MSAVGPHTAPSVLDPYVTVDANDNIYLTGVNLHIRNGSGWTGSLNGLGNLIVGYNESWDATRTGSHNLVVAPITATPPTGDSSRDVTTRSAASTPA